MLLTTKRIEIQIMSVEALKLRLSNNNELKEAYRLDHMPLALDEHMKRVYQLKCLRIEENPEFLIYHTYYAMIHKDTRTIIGHIGLQGVYDEEGAVEIGYFLDQEYWNGGLMTEALDCVCTWLLTLPEIASIHAFTQKENLASQAVLKKCGFAVKYRQNDMILWNRAL